MPSQPKQSPESTEPQLRKIDQEELDTTIRWLSSVREDTSEGRSNGEQEGIPQELNFADMRGLNFHHANFRGALFRGSDLRGALLRGCNLQDAEFIGANLRGARLNGANLTNAYFPIASLEGASLFGVDLAGANVQDAVLWGADLRQAKMGDVKGLKADALAGADVAGAELPQDIKEFQGLAFIAAAAAKASKLFTALMLACLYCWITLSSLMINAGTAGNLKLPVVGVDMSPDSFVLVAPLIVLSLFVYMHLYLQNIWQAMAVLPAVFPDGTKLPQKAGAWLPLGFATSYIDRLKKARGINERINHLLTLLLLWVVAPLTIAWFAIVSYQLGLLLRHVVGVLGVVSVVLAVYFYIQARQTLTLAALKKSQGYHVRFKP